MIIIKKKVSKVLVKRYFPDFDFSKPITTEEWRWVKGIIRAKEKKSLKKIKMENEKMIFKKKEVPDGNFKTSPPAEI